MSALGEVAEEYLALRQALGYKLAEATRLLPRLVAHLDERSITTLTVTAALDWACLPAVDEQTSTVWPRRLSVARGFARYLQSIDAATEVPPDGLLPLPAHRAVPYLYSADDVASLLEAARSLPTALRAATFETLIGLLAVTGMRIGEAIRLELADVDWPNAVVAVRGSKFGKSRELALHPSTVDALAGYTQHPGRPRTSALFVSRSGTPLIYTNVCAVFGDLVRRAGLEPRPPARPRLHDFRHSFAVRTLRDWYAQGVDVQARLPWLSTYLGHVEPASTYWYLSACPELLALAARRLETFEASR